ncbi:hypothetical protein DL764_008754 [Monosporascus ibericus]|uniref:WSC domain-containing protein n=1 Tax=Monosporascus ibericus TaxID=155417 RepID=A0A4Q4SYY2_9PEZI|nr:hypothetical protein DL764_008754 [Monosporascus ibericus]
MAAQLKSALLVLATAAVAVGQTYTYVGCFSEPPENSSETQNQFQSLGLCQSTCRDSQQPVAALSNGINCLCGNMLPPRDHLVEEDNCNLPCAGFDRETCGGDGFFSVYFEEPTESEDGAATQEPPVRGKCSAGSKA